MAIPGSAELEAKLICPTCRGKGEIAPGRVVNGILSVVCPVCRGYGAPKPEPATNRHT